MIVKITHFCNNIWESIKTYQGTGEGSGDEGGIKGDINSGFGLVNLKFFGSGPGFRFVGNLIMVSLTGFGRLLFLFVPVGDPTKSISASST